MKRIILALLLALSVCSVLQAQELKTPSQANGFSKPSTYKELTSFVQQLDLKSDFLETEVIGQSSEQRNLYALKFSSSGFGKDPSKIKVLIFAQQHGNEQSGKEGALLLAAELVKPENHYLFDRIDLAVVPQMNPDGSEKNQRRNGHDMDLNRNHLILTEPETRAMHSFFDKYLFEVTEDVHEYSPYSEDWEKYGYRKNADITLGTTTNVNVWDKIRELSNQDAVPSILKYLNNKGYSSFVYCPGGPPGVDYIRHSTFDINDGRQSLGILNSFSFIQEGMNGEDTFADNLQKRATSQMTGMMGLLDYAYKNQISIKELVAEGRKQLLNPDYGSTVSIQMEHVPNGSKLMLPLKSYSTQADTVVEVSDYRPVVKSTLDVTRPMGYLVPASNNELINWLDSQAIIHSKYLASGKASIEQYKITKIDSLDFERDIIINPVVESRIITLEDPSSYIFVPVNQLKGNMIIIALEPKSELGLVTYKQFEDLLKPGLPFPVLRLDKQ
ncbi:MAG: hypothetical protein HXX13_09095 [Bacteroidetes bacterium]|nr:hypothetical protein [Bacteroidota bacterium]